MQRFVHEHNLTRYIDLLESERDPVVLGQIQKLLIEEEDQFGCLAERVDQADRLIEDGQRRLHRQQALVACMQSDGAEKARAVALLGTMERTLQLMLTYRRTLSDRLDCSRL